MTGRTSRATMQGWSWTILKPAKAEAKKALSDIAKDEMPDGDWRDFVAIVKDEAGRKIVRVKLSLVVENLL
jgi:hypothetical protein